MGHINHISLQKTLGLKSEVKLDACKICIESKLTNQQSKEITPKPKVHLKKVVTNLYKPTINGERYIIFFLDSATRHLKFKVHLLTSLHSASLSCLCYCLLLPLI